MGRRMKTAMTNREYIVRVHESDAPDTLVVRVYEAGPRGRLVWSARRQRHMKNVEYVAVTNRGLSADQSLALIRELIVGGLSFQRALEREESAE